MRRLVAIVLVASSSCGLADALDGHIDDLQHCCAAVTEARIRRCVAKFVEPGQCYLAVCEPPIGDVETFVAEDGGITTCP